jgi:zinc transporter ZupT
MFFIAKSAVSILLLAITAAAGILPIIRRERRTSLIIKLSNACARGVFLAAGFVHFLPDALQAQTQPSTLNTLSIFSLVALTILLFEYGEKLSWQAAKVCEHRACFPLYALLGMLCIHALIEGTGIGIQNNLTDLLMVSFAIVAHKIAVSFSLAIQMMNHHIKKKKAIIFLILFSCMTPVAILLSTWLTATPQKLIEPNDLISGIDAICAGTFMYIGLMHHETTEGLETATEKKVDQSNPSIDLLFTLIGFSCMTILAYWV